MFTLQSVRVLVLDNDRGTLDTLAEALRSAGASVLAAATVREALVGFVKQHPAVIVSDLCTPGRDGVNFMREVRALDHACGTMTAGIAITTADNDHDQARRAGFDEFLTKPVDPAELCSKVAALAGH